MWLRGGFDHVTITRFRGSSGRTLFGSSLFACCHRLRLQHKAPITLNKSNYLNVKHWERRWNDAVQVSVIKVHDTDSDDSDSKSDNNKPEGITKKERGVLAFLEDKNSNVIGYRQKKRLYAKLRAFWNDNIDLNRPPKNWSSAGATLHNKFCNTIKEKFPFLCLCAWRWKVDELWKKNYHS